MSAKGHGTTKFAAYQEETKDDTSDEQPSSNIKGDCHTVLGLGTVVKDLVRPLFGGQHGDGGEDVQDVDKEVLEHNNIEPHIPRGKVSRRVRKSRARALLTWIACHSHYL